MRGKGKTLCALLLVLLFFFALWGVPAAAQGGKSQPVLSARASSEAAYAGQKVEILVSVGGLLKSVSCFDMEIQADPDRFTFKKITPLAGMGKAELSCHTAGGVSYLVYCDREGGGSPVHEGALFSVTYTVREGASPGQVQFLVQCTGMGDGKAEQLGVSSAKCAVTVTSPPSGNALLRRMTPDNGRLVPAFSPQVFSYTLEVSAETERVKLALKTAEAQAVAKVNRETLGGKGKSTRLVVTVTAPDRSVKKYIITVLRKKGGKAANLEEVQNPPGGGAKPPPGNTGNQGAGQNLKPLHAPDFPLGLAAMLFALTLAMPFLFRWLYGMTGEKGRVKS